MSETTSPAPEAQTPAPTQTVEETTLWLDGRILLAALKFASSDDTRFAMNGVCLDVAFKDSRIRAFATDGRRAVAMLAGGDGMASSEGTEATGDRFILPADLIKRIKPLISKGEPNVQLEIQRGPKDGKRRVLAVSPISKRGVIGETVEAVFPNLSAVFTNSPEPLVGGKLASDGTAMVAGSQFFGAVNTEYLADFGDLLRTLDPSRGGGALIYRTGDCSRALRLRPTDPIAITQVEAVITPINSDDVENVWECPDWLAQPAQSAAPLIENMSVTIRTGETTVTIDADGIHGASAPAAETTAEPVTAE